MYFCCEIVLFNGRRADLIIRYQATLAACKCKISRFNLYQYPHPMADVIDVVHKITYEVDDKALQNATVLIERQILELKNLTETLRKHQQQLVVVKSYETARFNELSRKIDETNKKIEASGSKLQGMFRQVGSGMLKGLGLNGELDKAVENFTEKLVGGFMKVEKFDFKSIASLATNLFSFTNIAPLAVSLLVDLAAKLFDTSNAASEADASYKEYLKTIKGNLKQTLRSNDEQQTELLIKRQGLKSTDPKVKKGSAQYFIDTYPNIFGKYTADDIVSGKANDQFYNLSAQIANKQNAELKKKNAADAQEQLRLQQTLLKNAKAVRDEAQKNFQEAPNESFADLETGTTGDARSKLNTKYQEADKNYQDILKKVSALKTRIENDKFDAAKFEALSPDLSFTQPAEERETDSRVSGSIESKLQLTRKQQEEEARSRKQHYANLEKLKLENLKRQQQLDEHEGKDTLALQIAISKQETSIVLTDTEDRYIEQYKTAKEAKQDLKKLEQEHLKEIAGIVEKGSTDIEKIKKEYQQREKENKKRSYEYEQTEVEAQSAEEMNKLTDRYVKGGISYEKYLKERRKLKLQNELNENKSQQDIVSRQLADAKSERGELNPDSKGAAELDNAINKLEIKLSSLKTNEQDIQASITDLHKQKILDTIADHQTLAQAVADAYNTIVQVQINALDKEIAIREKRVEAAQKLAEKGNVEALRIEEERLQKTQQMREQYARRQQAVNAAITVSNAIAAVARAALEGGGFGSVATIAALLAALAAGYAAVTSMSNDNAYADGVVDFRGKGGPRDDANWVRISTGESVITAEGTRNNRHLLEAINNGAKLQFMNPALANTIPVFANPQYSTQGYASTYDLKVVESKLDGVINAIEDNRMKQNIFFNEHGVGIMTERAIRKDRKKWM